MNPEEISKKANEERERLKKLAELESKNKSRFKKKEYIPISPDSWSIYSKIYPYYYNVFIWVFVVFTIGFVALFMYLIETTDIRVLYIGILFISAFVFRLLLFNFVKVLRFSKYKNWRNDIGFNIIGWDVIGKNENFPSFRNWDRYTEVKVNLASNAIGIEKQYVKDALFLFCTNANSWFYTASQVQSGYLGDIRLKWNMTTDFSCKGSADAKVLGCFYLFVSNHLRTIHAKYNCISSVKIKFSNDIITIKPPDRRIS